MKTMTTELNASIPLLLVELIQVEPSDPQRVTATVLAGGHRLRVILDYSRRERMGVEYVEMPKLLDIHRPSKQAITRLMGRFYDGEKVDLPIDLTEQIRHLSPPSPYQPMPASERAALETLADDVNLEIAQIQGAGDDPLSFTATLCLDGREFEMTGKLYAGPGKVSFLSWRGSAETDSLSRPELYAIERALVRWKSEQR